MFEPDVFREQMYSSEESICDIVGTFRRPPQSSDASPQWLGRPQSDTALGKLCLPRYVPVR